jgi:hypothetical protein
MALADQQCVPCRGGVPPLPRERIDALLRQLESGWTVTPTGLLRTYEFRDFAGAGVRQPRRRYRRRAGPSPRRTSRGVGAESDLDAQDRRLDGIRLLLAARPIALFAFKYPRAFQILESARPERATSPPATNKQ